MSNGSKTFSGRWWLDRANTFMSPFNLHVDTLTSSRAEQRRLQNVNERNGFSLPVFPVPASFTSSPYRNILADLPAFQERFDTFQDKSLNSVGYQLDNGYFSSPDAEILYAIIRQYCPRRILEIGCGHSTKLIRQAIRDGDFSCKHTGIDPQPRQEIAALVDQTIPRSVETLNSGELAAPLTAGDVLFIDTSHEIKPANDVAFIYGSLLPKIAPGVIIHIHDIFLPYEYPFKWVSDLGYVWGELYIVQTMLTQSSSWEVLWPGYYLQRTLPEFDSFFPHSVGRFAQSLWLRKL